MQLDKNRKDTSIEKGQNINSSLYMLLPVNYNLGIERDYSSSYKKRPQGGNYEYKLSSQINPHISRNEIRKNIFALSLFLTYYLFPCKSR